MKNHGVRQNLGVRRHDAAFDPGDMSPQQPPINQNPDPGDMSPQTESGDMSPHSKPTAWHHAPLHRLEEQGIYMVTAGTLQKQHFFKTPELLDLLHDLLLEFAHDFGWQMQTWAVFSNHYHFVAASPDNPQNLRKFLGKLHMKSAQAANQRDQTPGRKVWYQYWESHITFEHSYWPRLRYVQENPVKHGLVPVASQYRLCSAGWFEQTAEPAVKRKLESYKIDQLEIYDDF